MSPQDSDSAESLLERLREVVSGDIGQRQLRRRYDALRRDYEGLLERVGELEGRLSGGEAGKEGAHPSEGIEEAVAVAARGSRLLPPPPAEEHTGGVGEGLVGPLLKLRDEYLAAAGGIQAIVQGLDGLAAAAFKGQRGAGPAAPRPAPMREHSAERPMQIEVKGSDFGELLEFQERHTSIDGVARVSIKAIDNERATLVVELREGRGPG